MPTMGWGLKYQGEYEAALGRLLVKYNDLEMTVAEILEQITIRLKVPHLYKQDAYLIQKCERLELALCAVPQKWPKPDFERLRRVNGRRNDLAHGHFHQDPNTGEYQTRPVHKTAKKAAPEIIEPATIDKYTAEVAEAQADVARLLPWVWFDDPVEDRPLPPGASSEPV